MAISGDLSALNLTELFQTLSQSGQQGTLTIGDGARTKHFIFTERGITLDSSEAQLTGSLGDILLARGTLTAATLQQSESLARQKGCSLEEALIEAGATDRREIDQALRTQVEEEMYDVFSWPEAQFEFVPGAPKEQSGEAPQTRLLFNVSGVLMEAARRLDEWQMIHADIPGLAAVVALQGPADAAAYEGIRRTAVALLDGARTVAEVCAQGHLPKFEICKFLQELVKSGKARVATPEELGAIAERELELANPERAVSLLRLALGQAPDLHALRLTLAETLEACGRPAEAATQYRRLAEVKAEANDPKTAVDILRVASELAPGDPAITADLFRVVIDNTAVLGVRPAELCKQWLPWVKGRAAAGDREGAARALDELLEEAPDQLELWSLKVQFAKDAGDTAGAVAALKAQLPLLEAQRARDGIRRLCNSIVALDPGEPEATARLAELDAAVPPGVIAQRQARRGGAVKVLLALVLIGGAGAAVGWREMQARDAVSAARGAAAGLAHRGEFTQAAAALREAAAQWPWTLAAQGVELEAARYESKGRQAERQTGE